MKKTLDVASTLLVMVAAGFVVWTQIESRWLRPTPGTPTNVKGLTIAADKVRHSRGTGRVALVEFTDYECPFCGRHSRDTAPTIDKELVDTGKIRHVVFNFPLPIHPHAPKASEAAECAARQGKYWEMSNHLFENQSALDEDGLKQAAATLGLDGEAFDKCLTGEAKNLVQADLKEGERLGIQSTPTFFVGLVQADGSIQLKKKVSGALPFAQFQTVIEAVQPPQRAQR